MENNDLHMFLRVMKALSDGNRVKMIKALETREHCVCEFGAALGITQPTVSRHLKILEEAGLVAARKDGKWVHYSIASDQQSAYAATLLRVMGGWLNNDAEIRNALERISQYDPSKLCVMKDNTIQ